MDKKTEPRREREPLFVRWVMGKKFKRLFKLVLLTRPSKQP